MKKNIVRVTVICACSLFCCGIALGQQTKEMKVLTVGVSLDVEKSLPVKINFTGKPKAGAKSYLVTGPSFKSMNTGAQPEVKVVEADVKDFATGSSLQVPPASLLALTWESEN